MPRANRYFVPGYAYHLTHRCHNREFLFKLASDRDRYRKSLRDGVIEFEIALLDYCLTRNHVHMIAFAEETQQISAFMQKVEGDYAQAYNRRNHYAAMIEKRIAEGRTNREPRWTDSVAVGSERFVREVASRIQGRQELEMVEEGDRWVLKELSAPYQTEGDRVQVRVDDVQGTA